MSDGRREGVREGEGESGGRGRGEKEREGRETG